MVKNLKLKMYCRWIRNYNRCMSKWKRKSIWYLFNFNAQNQNQFLKSNNPRNSQLYELAIQFQSRSSRCWNVILDHGQHKGAKAKNAQFHTGRFSTYEKYRLPISFHQCHPGNWQKCFMMLKHIYVVEIILLLKAWFWSSTY